VGLAAGIVVAIIVVAVSRLLQPSPQPEHHPRSVPTPQATAAPTVAPDIQQAINIANTFVAAYLSYDWQHPPDMQTALKPLTSERLYNSLIVDGTTPQGSIVPWAKVRPDLHETDTVWIQGTSSQVTDAGQAAVQSRVKEVSNTDSGHSEVSKEVDLSLQKQNGYWLVDWVSERGPQQ
jgi:hypothetical protein